MNEIFSPALIRQIEERVNYIVSRDVSSREGVRRFLYDTLESGIRIGMFTPNQSIDTFRTQIDFIKTELGNMDKECNEALKKTNVNEDLAWLHENRKQIEEALAFYRYLCPAAIREKP